MVLTAPPRPWKFSSRWLGILVLASLAGSAISCSRGNAARRASKHLSVELAARCAQAGPQPKPLLVEWPGIQRGSMEAQFKRADGRLVVVRYHGCEMEVLRTCSIRGKYTWTPFEPKTDTVTIRDSDEVYAKAPLGAVELVTAVERYGALRLDMTLLGEYDSRQIEFSREHLEGDCELATHVVTAATVGAFEIRSAAGAKLGASAKFGRAGAGVVGRVGRAGRFGAVGCRCLRPRCCGGRIRPCASGLATPGCARMPILNAARNCESCEHKAVAN